jgi:hypothetical protein
MERSLRSFNLLYDDMVIEILCVIWSRDSVMCRLFAGAFINADVYVLHSDVYESMSLLRLILFLFLLVYSLNYILCRVLL